MERAETEHPTEPGADHGRRVIPDAVASGWIRHIADQWVATQRDDQKRQDLSGASLRR